MKAEHHHIEISIINAKLSAAQAKNQNSKRTFVAHLMLHVLASSTHRI
jgi:hypothetical protein